MPPKESLTDTIRHRFEEKIVSVVGGHHLWRGNAGRQFAVGVTLYDARAVAWTLAGRDVPPGKKPAASCGEENCLAPDHLWLVEDRKGRPPVAKESAPPKERRQRAPRNDVLRLETVRVNETAGPPPIVAVMRSDAITDTERMDLLDRSITTVVRAPGWAIVYTPGSHGCGYGKTLREACDNAIQKEREEVRARALVSEVGA